MSGLSNSIRVLALVLVLAACRTTDAEGRSDTDQPAPGVSFTVLDTTFSSSIRRMIDENAGVVCYIYSGYEKAGIDCMPLSETELEP